MKRNLVRLAIMVCVCAIALVGCSRGKGPAEAAIKAIEEALNASRIEAMRYVPDEVKSVESALAALKEKFDKGEFKAVASEAPALTEKAKGLLALANAKKEELTKAWADLDQEVPKMMDAIQGRVDSLSKHKKLPTIINADKFEEVKSELAANKEEWVKALESFKTGNLVEAVSVANTIKGKAVAAMETLGISMPAEDK